MNIKTIKTRQFAGIKNKEVILEDGLNLLVGNNETGKSTLIELIYQMFYRSSKLSKKEDKDFFARYIPSNSKGDVVDGTIVFTTTDGEYTLQKKWGAIAGCELVDSNGNIIANEDKIREIIAAELIYKQGLYDDVIFASQKNQSDVVEHILNKLDKKALVKQDLVSIIAAEGMTSTEGIAPEDIEKIIQSKIDELSGHWDFTIDGPEKRRGIENPWAKDKGTILNAYYKLAELEEKLRKSEMAEKAIEADNIKIQEAKKKLDEYSDEKSEYERYAEVLATYKSGMKLKQEYKIKQKELNNDLISYPELIKKYETAIQLDLLFKAEQVINSYRNVENVRRRLSEAEAAIAGKMKVNPDDERRLLDAESVIIGLKAKLSNLDLAANIKKLGVADITVKSVATGEVIDISTGNFDINETVEITIPGIMSLTIAAKGINVDEVQKQLAEKTAEYNTILEKYKVSNTAEFREIKEEYTELLRKFEITKAEYDRVVDGIEISELEIKYTKVKDKEAELEGLAKKTEELCGTESITAFIAKQGQKLEIINDKYGRENTVDIMRSKLSELGIELDKLQYIEDETANIPEKYLNLEDLDAYKSSLNSNIEAANQKIKEAEGNLHEDEKRLGDIAPDDLRAYIDDALVELKKSKDEYNRWKHILEVLVNTRENMAGESAMPDVQKKFAKYLSVITDGKIVLKSMDDNMDVNIQSGDNPITYDILSEGTKDTIALSFRLAILEHLFPEGDGFVIFDDPFTDMDENRTKQACKLVQNFADAGNQVIFVTCDNKYKQLLQGNLVEI